MWNFLIEKIKEHPNSLFFDDKHQYTYSEFIKRSEEVGNKLLAKCTERSKCAILCDCGLNTALAILSCWYSNMIPIPMSLHYGHKHCENILSLTQPDILLTDIENIHLFPFQYNIKNGRFVGEESKNNENDKLNDIAVIMCTSGTTGIPKGALITNNGLQKNVRKIAEYFLVNSNDRIMIARPMYHCAVLTGEFLISIFKGLDIGFFDYKFHPQYMLQFVAKHKISVLCGTPTLFHQIEVRNSLKAVYESNIQKNESMKIALDQIGSMLTTSPVPYAFLKGAYLIYLYPTGLRTSNDLDIFVSQDNLSAIEEKLKESGFSQGNIRNGNFVPASRKEIVSSRMNRGETVPFIKQVMLPQMDFLEIDINFSLDFQAKQKNSNVSMLLKNAKPLIKTSFSSLYTLDSIDFIIHLCCHLFKEATVYAWVAMERDLSLYKFVDIYMILYEHTDKLWYDNLALAIKEYGLEKECYYALLHTKELFRIDNRFIENLINNIRPTNLNYLNNIIQPDKGKVYIYKEPFSEWVFMSKKKERLNEITDEIS